MYTRDLNRVYALIISGERRKGGEEKEKKKKGQEVTPVMGKHNFIIVMTRSATVALGAYTVRLGSRIDKRSVEFSTLHVRPPVAHT